MIFNIDVSLDEKYHGTFSNWDQLLPDGWSNRLDKDGDIDLSHIPLKFQGGRRA